MTILQKHIESGDFHHGYLLAGDFDLLREIALKAAKTILSPKGKTEAHPDFFHQTFELLGIKDSLELRQKASMRPFAGANKVFIIEILAFTTESANALLKTFEEPYEGTHFFIIVPSVEDILPTLTSRLTVVKVAGEVKKQTGDNKEIKNFLSDLPAERLKTIKSFLKDRHQAIEFLNKLEIVLENISLGDKPSLGGSAAKWKALEEIQKNKEFLSSRGSSPKMVLEHIALVLPKMIK